MPVQSYHVDRSLTEGDILDAGGPLFQVLHTPGHALGHIALYAPDEQILLCGDAMHSDDVGWINSFREGAGALERALETVRCFAALPIRLAYSGHGAAITDPARAIEAAQRRYEKWLTEPIKLAWHACKRIFTYVLYVCYLSCRLQAVARRLYPDEVNAMKRLVRTHAHASAPSSGGGSWTRPLVGPRACAGLWRRLAAS